MFTNIPKDIICMQLIKMCPEEYTGNANRSCSLGGWVAGQEMEGNLYFTVCTCILFDFLKTKCKNLCVRSEKVKRS